ncbi:DNA-binding beta-propeller fold protein YncE [Babesia caballi]|uniref:DNA-binding beta-propeller fold protein YncE n=1 Tax=Babesia caballi TaxID=5871 RepID=A0AAV4LY62_BABCB|nr:DNA-binding beta-propeller fold protein YncE [Babesia caballi]
MPLKIVATLPTLKYTAAAPPPRARVAMVPAMDPPVDQEGWGGGGTLPAGAVVSGCSPVSPSSPLGPWGPAGPRAPTGPIGPAGPGGPTGAVSVTVDFDATDGLPAGPVVVVEGLSVSEMLVELPVVTANAVSGNVESEWEVVTVPPLAGLLEGCTNSLTFSVKYLMYCAKVS